MSLPYAFEASDIAMLEIVRPSQKSLETETMLSTSSLEMPASSKALLVASKTSSAKVSFLSRSYLVWPTPIIATFSILLSPPASRLQGAEMLDVEDVSIAFILEHRLHPHARLDLFRLDFIDEVEHSGIGTVHLDDAVDEGRFAGMDCWFLITNDRERIDGA